MTKTFDPRTSYSVARDVRRDFCGELADLIHNHKPSGAFWPLIAPRRGGKTWTLNAVKHELSGRSHSVTLVELPQHEAELFGDFKPILLIDEPGRWLCGKGKNFQVAKRKKFFERCHELTKRGSKVLVAMSPGEYEFLLGLDAVHLPKDSRPIPCLTGKQGRKLASRADWARATFEQLGESWQRHVFLLELALEQAEQMPTLRTSIQALQSKAIEASRSYEHKYVHFVFVDGLSSTQQETLRNIAWQQSVSEADTELLIGCGLVEKVAGQLRIADPVLENHLPPPLRIHHLSDIHVGDKSARVIDVKAKGSVGGTLAKGAGDRLARDVYLEHVQSLGDQRPHLVVISGDLAERGDPALYAEFDRWLEQLERQLAAHPDLLHDDPRVLVVGGNHDVDWGETLGAAGARKRHQPFAAAFKDRPRPKLEDEPDKRSLTTVAYPEARVAFCLLGSAEYGGQREEDEAWQRAVDAVEELRKEADRLIKDEKWAESSALLDKLGRIDPGLVHHKEIQRLKSKKLLEPIRIAVLHHPVSPLPFTEVSQYSGTINAGALKDAFMSKEYCLVLHGHMHIGWFAEERWPDRHHDWTLRIAAAGSLGSKEKDEQHSFNEVIVTREGDACRVHVRRFIRRNDLFTIDKTLGPFTPGKP